MKFVAVKPTSRIFLGNFAAVSPLLNNDFSKPSAIAYDERLRAPVARLDKQVKLYKDQSGRLDRTVILALSAVSRMNREHIPSGTGINLGSSRGATQLFERELDRFRESDNPSIHTSPMTTLGNISTEVARFLQLDGPAFSHSITCSTSAHSILNAIAWITAGMAKDFICGGSEAPLTPFTVAQMKAIGIHATAQQPPFCEPHKTEKSNNGMVLGEAACSFMVSGSKQKADMEIKGYGMALDKLESPTSLSTDGQGFQNSMAKAISGMDRPDAIITHAPGTIKGDRAEMTAIDRLFGKNAPRLFNNKWQIGHTLGASAAMSLLLARDLLHGRKVRLSNGTFYRPEKLNTILVNAAGFGGNHVSLLVSKI